MTLDMNQVVVFVDVIVGVVFARKLTIGAFDIIVTGLRRNAQQFIRIHDAFVLRSFDKFRQAPAA